MLPDMVNFSTFSSAETPQVIQQLQTLYHLAIIDQERERQQVAAYLNDTAVQTLSALYIDLSLLLSAPDAELRHELAEALPLLADLMTGLTNLARELRPLELDSFGLHEALQLAAETFSQPGRLTVRYEGSSVPELPQTIVTALFRLSQAWLLALQSSSQATEGVLQLHALNQGVCLIIQDNGNLAEPALDLLGQMVHFEQLNGCITHQVQPGIGTTITAVWPWPNESLQNSPGCNPVQNKPG